MKFIVLGIGLIFSASSYATVLNITSDALKEKGELQPYAQELVSTLRNSGANFVDLGKGVYTLGVMGLHCDHFGNGAIDTDLPDYMVETTKCRIGAKNDKGTKTGRPFQVGMALSQLLNRMQSDVSKYSEIYFADCAMGYCATYAKTVECWVDTNIVAAADGRYRCRLDDGN